MKSMSIPALIISLILSANVMAKTVSIRADSWYPMNGEPDSEKEGFMIACCSNSIRKTIEDMLTRANIIQYFDLILSNEDVDKAKPSPDIYTKAIRYTFG